MQDLEYGDGNGDDIPAEDDWFLANDFVHMPHQQLQSCNYYSRTNLESRSSHLHHRHEIPRARHSQPLEIFQEGLFIGGVPLDHPPIQWQWNAMDVLGGWTANEAEFVMLSGVITFLTGILSSEDMSLIVSGFLSVPLVVILYCLSTRTIFRPQIDFEFYSKPGQDLIMMFICLERLIPMITIPATIFLMILEPRGPSSIIPPKETSYFFNFWTAQEPPAPPKRRDYTPYLVNILFTYLFDTSILLFRISHAYPAFKDICVFEIVAFITPLTYLALPILIINAVSCLTTLNTFLWIALHLFGSVFSGFILIGTLTYPEIIISRTQELSGRVYMVLVALIQILLGGIFLCTMTTVITLGRLVSEETHPTVPQSESGVPYPVGLSLISALFGIVFIFRMYNVVMALIPRLVELDEEVVN